MNPFETLGRNPNAGGQGVRLKICGITRPEDIETCATFGVDALGFLIRTAPGPADSGGVHRLSTETARTLVRVVPSHMASVLLIHEHDPRNIVRLVEAIQPTCLQVQVNLSVEDLTVVRQNASSVKIVKSVHIYPDSTEFEIMTEAVSWISTGLVDAILLDSRLRSSKRTGGTGLTHNWDISAVVRERLGSAHVILAGGLNPSNICRAISLVRPYAVDVMTGVESTAGEKDPEKIKALVRALDGA